MQGTNESAPSGRQGGGLPSEARERVGAKEQDARKTFSGGGGRLESLIRALEEVCPIEPLTLPDTSERRQVLRRRRYHMGAPRVGRSEDSVVAGEVDARKRDKPTQSRQE